MDKERVPYTQNAGSTLTRIREQGPLVHNITNYVVPTAATRSGWKTGTQ